MWLFHKDYSSDFHVIDALMHNGLQLFFSEILKSVVGEEEMDLVPWEVYLIKTSDAFVIGMDYLISLRF